MKYGNHTVASYEMYWLVGTEKTSAEYISNAYVVEKWVQRTVNFFQSELLGLPYEAEYHKPSNEIEPGIESD